MHKNIYIQKLEEAHIDKLKELNLDSVIVGGANASDTVLLIKQHLPDLTVFSEIRTFAGDELSFIKDAQVVDASGNKLESSYLCPSNESILEFRLKEVDKLLTFDINGIWLNTLKYPTLWAQPEPKIHDTCYCDRCLTLFENIIDEELEGSSVSEKALEIDGLYYHEWLEFKTNLIADFALEVKEPIKKKNSDNLLGIFIVPWEDNEYGNANKRILGQDFNKLVNIADILSPMLFHKMTDNKVSWIKDKIEYFWNLGVPFLPTIQSEDKYGKLMPTDFKHCLENAVLPPSMGVSVFYFDDLITSPEKFTVLKAFFNN